jgi:hypothetical protein
MGTRHCLLHLSLGKWSEPQRPGDGLKSLQQIDLPRTLSWTPLLHIFMFLHPGGIRRYLISFS